MGIKLVGFANPDGSGRGNWSQAHRLPSALREIVEFIAALFILPVLFLGFPFLLWMLAAAGGS